MPPEQQDVNKEPLNADKATLPEREPPATPPLPKTGIARKIAYALTFVAGAGGMYALDRIPPNPHDGPSPLKRPNLLLPPENQESPDHFTLAGITKAAPGRLAKISLATSQAVAFVDVKLGDRVKKGWQVFSHWESPEGLEATKKDIDRAQTILAASTARAEGASAHLARVQQAWQSRAVSAQELEEAETLARVRAAEVSAAHALLETAKLRFAEADFHFQQAFVTSPIDGAVVEVSVTPGERRQIGGPFRGVVVLDQRVLSVRCSVDPRKLQILRHMSGGDVTALHATVNVGGKTYSATMKAVGLRADERTQLLPLILEVQNPTEELPCDIPVNVTFSAKK